MAVFKLPALPVNWKTQPQLFENYWASAMKAIEKAIVQLQGLPLIQAAIEAAQDAADAANAAAADATAAASDSMAATAATEAETSLVNSGITSFAAPLLSADSSGNITIANHTRAYGNSTLNPSASVTGATISTTAVSGDIVRVYYSDASRAGGSVTYLYTIDPAAPVAQKGNNHSVGAVEIPLVGSNDGREVRQPGYIYL